MTPSEATPNAIAILDEIDQEIISLLRTDGRMSFTEVGKRLDMPEATARYRVQRLVKLRYSQAIPSGSSC